MPAIKTIWFNTFRRRIEKNTISGMIRANSHKIIFPFYHTVSNEPLPHIKHLYRHNTVSEFIRDMDFLLRNFTPLHYDDLISERYLENTPYFHLSFDDGLAEIFPVIRPILMEKGIPATFFINSAFVDNKGLMYRYKVSMLIERVPKDKLAKCIFEGEEKTSVQVKDPARFLLQFDSRQEPWIDRIAQRAGVDFEDYLQTQKPYLSHAELHTLQDEGFTIGAHSVDHPNFPTIAASAQREQVGQSVEFVRTHFSVPNPAFAFPFTADGADAELLRIMHADFGISRSFGTAGMQTRKNALHIERIPAGFQNWSLEMIIKAEYHYLGAKKMFGR